jgi:hypothetical protein
LAALGAFAALGGSACAMSAGSGAAARCHVIDGAKLPAESGGPQALCAAIERAAASRAPGVRFRAEVRVLSESTLAATVTRDGQALPEQKFATMDRPLTAAAFERFAGALADRLAEGH